MKRYVIKTQDDSHTIFDENLDEIFHSRRGAIAESKHVFIEYGLKAINSNKPELNILEYGFGTGLNVLLTFIEQSPYKIYYESLEKYPLDETLWSSLNYTEVLNNEEIFQKIHKSEWEKDFNLNPNFILHKTLTDFENFNTNTKYDLVYFDAFSPEKQPNLWEVHIFKDIYNFLNESGVLVTYSAKGQVRRNLIEAGFTVEKLPGPPGKREMLRATKR